MPDQATKPEASTEVFAISRTFAAPVDRLWAAWTSPDQLSAWMGPPGCTTTNLRLELRPGGVSHSRFQTPGGPPFWGKFVYREVVEPTRLVWVHSIADAAGDIIRAPWSPNWPLELLTTVTIEPDGASAAKVTLTWSPLNAGPEEREAFSGAMDSMQGGWDGSFDRLAAHLASEPHSV